ncbi:MAG: DUF4124 domain-containing protein [Pseudomonadales bacterium]|jgi:hypothetical protein|nr:DUF4124 domain-containing protein [Pseudomonadales bacterium]HMU89199.1 DUF4124 domain-containing protein [Pseudomonadales bacterium]HMW14525.1 DUF4124 domain-containing protein [Pseudomonadales bacterium]HMW82316.1 DUF4124 domain-containing protein [Pseudomonadales bacterium]HMY96013.1 DUF4124 domain-containing protein [Pseudomonadales bacterium]
MSRFIIAIIALLFAMQLQAADRVYRWSDAAGRPHFGDHPPADAPSERMQLTSARFAAPPGEARTPQQEIVRLLRAMEADHAADAARLARQRQEAAVRAGRCQQAEQQLALYRLGMPVFKEGEQGERLFLNESERSAAFSAWRGAAERDCDSAS